MLSSHSYRLSVRRFVQELFLDLNYNELHEEPRKLLGQVTTIIFCGDDAPTTTNMSYIHGICIVFIPSYRNTKESRYERNFGMHLHAID